MSDDAPKFKYLNTDLDLVCARDLTPLTVALSGCGVFPLSVDKSDDLWYSTLETRDCLSEPEITIRAMLDAIETIEGNARQLWTECSKREFNIGYDCGDEPWGFNNGLTNSTLSRISGLGGTLRITLYPYRADP